METPSKKLSREFWVGTLVVSVVAILIAFAWGMGVLGPLKRQVRYFLLYNFAGGVEVGSPVRVSGVKAGKVSNIEFLENENSNGERVTLKVTVDVAPNAARIVKKDSKFFINMAGIIGERYIEVSPGSTAAGTLEDGASVRGEDPPRIDQLLSQGYGVFGRVQEFLETNEETIKSFLGELNHFMLDAGKLLKGSDKDKIIKLVENLSAVTMDVHKLAKKMDDERTQKTIDEIHDLIDRAHDIDRPALKKFFQDEGIRTKIF